MSIQPKISIDSLISDQYEYFEYPEDAKYNNLNYALRAVMGYLISYYEQIPDVGYACDHLAKMIAQLEN